MKIREIELLTGLSAKAIRYYERRGLLNVSRTENQYRTYTDADVTLLCEIKQMRELGIATADIRLWRDGVVSKAELLEKMLREYEQDAAERKKHREICEALLHGEKAIAKSDIQFEEQEMKTVLREDVPLSLGVDIGTTSISAQLVELESGTSVHLYNIDHHAALSSGDRDAFAEDGTMLVNRVLALIHSIVDSYPGVRSIGLTGQMHGICCLGSDGEILSPLYTWQNKFGDRISADGRTYSEEIFGITEESVPTGYGVCTLYCLEKIGRMPLGVAKIATVMDVVGMKLCGNTSPFTHPTNASSLGLYDHMRGAFMEDKLARLGLDPKIMPEICSGILGEYHSIPVSCAIGDNQAGIFGSLDNDRKVLVNVGTSGQVSVIAENPKIGGGECRPYVFGKYIKIGATLCGGRAYAVFADFVGEIAHAFGVEPSRKEVYDYLNRIAEEKTEYPLTVQTTFCGSRSDPFLRGRIENIGLENLSPGAFARGILYGIVSELYGMFEEITSVGTDFVPVVSGNAMRRNPILREIVREMFGHEPFVPVHLEEAAFGAALYASVTTGILTEKDARKFIRYN